MYVVSKLCTFMMVNILDFVFQVNYILLPLNQIIFFSDSLAHMNCPNSQLQKVSQSYADCT